MDNIYFQLYIVFSIIITVVGIIGLVVPVVTDVMFEQPLNPISQSPIITYLVFIGGFLILAPLIAYPLMYVPAGERFKMSLYNGLMERN